MKNIRNFSIIAHVDHGKSTLADRFIQECGGLDAREMQAQVLDTLRFKCDVLWVQLDALHLAYVEPGLIPPGAFAPERGR